jgi:hypothetical protein
MAAGLSCENDGEATFERAQVLMAALALCEGSLKPGPDRGDASHGWGEAQGAGDMLHVTCGIPTTSECWKAGAGPAPLAGVSEL